MWIRKNSTTIINIPARAAITQDGSDIRLVFFEPDKADRSVRLARYSDPDRAADVLEAIWVKTRVQAGEVCYEMPDY